MLTRKKTLNKQWFNKEIMSEKDFYTDINRTVESRHTID